MVPAPTARIPWRSPTLQIVLASTLLAPLGVPLISPALPIVRDAFGISDAQASLLITAYFLTGIVLSPFIGVLADRVGRRRVLVPSLFVFAIAGGATVLAPTFGVVLMLRLIQGTAAAGVFITTVAIIGDVFEGAQRNTVLGVNNAVLSVGAATFPVLGGALAAVTWTAPFLVYLAALPLGLLALRYLEEPPGERESRGIASLAGAIGSLTAVEATTFYGTAFLAEFLTFGAIFTALPFLLAAGGTAPVTIGLLLTVSAVASALVSTANGRFARHVSNGELIAAGFVCYGLGLLAAWLAPSVVFVAVAVVIFGAGFGLTMPAVDAGISNRVTSRYRAGALSLRNSTTFLGRAVGPVLFASVAVTTGYEPLLGLAGVVALAGAILLALSTDRRDHPVERRGGSLGPGRTRALIGRRTPRR